MNTLKLKNTLLCVLLTLTTFSVSQAQQNDPKAKTLLNALSKKYRSFNAIKTNFRFILDNPQQGVKNFTQTGMIIVKPSQNKFHITLYEPSMKQKTIGQEIVGDGKTQWTYTKRDNEIQINNADNSSGTLNPAQVFTMYEKGYKYTYEGQVKVVGNTYEVVQLTPEDSKKSIFKIRLQIDKAKSLINTATLFDKSGNKYTYILDSPATNFTGSDAIFALNPKNFPGADVVDLR